MTDIEARLRAALDEPGLYLTEPDEVAPYGVDWTRKFSGRPALVARPNSVAQVATLLRTCDAHGIALVPQGGNTGLVGGSVPRDGEVVLSLARLNAIEEFDSASGTVRVQAGVVLETLHRFLAEREQVFPVDLGARGSCQLGGMAATNAGGVKVIRYGHVRDQIRGIEAVLADGTVVSGLNKLRKNNTGLDLKQLFIGSEGILGVITRLVLQAHPRPAARHTALFGVESAAAAIGLLEALRRGLPGLSSLEMIRREAIELLCRHDAGARRPFATNYPLLVLVEAETGAGAGERDGFLAALAAALEAGHAADAVIAESEDQAVALWQLREGVTEAIGREGLTHKFDVTVPPGRIPEILSELDLIAETLGGVLCLVYGHLGDGNLHVNMVQERETPDEVFCAKGAPLAGRIYNLVADAEGSISAEHGIGIMKRDYLGLCRTQEEIALMRRLKRTLDPNGVLNPGVIFAD